MSLPTPVLWRIGIIPALAGGFSATRASLDNRVLVGLVASWNQDDQETRGAE
jgi:hypothetical protein